MILYRGSLKSCNYSCSYCPFSKHRMSERELQKDRQQWNFFVEAYLKRAELKETEGCHCTYLARYCQPEKEAGARELEESISQKYKIEENEAEAAEGIDRARAMMVVPYGEALIHPWYWEGLAQISALSITDAVGAQTNLSFPIQQSIELFQKRGGILEKLRIWATFHPQMVSAAEFAGRCRQLKEAGVRLCAGAVGVPGHQSIIKRLRSELPDDIYLWVNRMDGMKREYTRQEIQAFLGIDPYFSRELLPHKAEPAQCRDRMFVEGDGRTRLCNISRASDTQILKCSQKRCSCYLAYGGRDELMNHVLFGPYPLFRIPRRAKAVFLDIEGTLLSADKDSVMAGLQALLRERIPVFFATTMPYEDAVKRCYAFRRFFQGGVFAAGAHIRMEGSALAEGVHTRMEENASAEKTDTRLEEADEVRESYAYFDEVCMKDLDLLKRKMHFRVLDYRHQGKCYKLTLLRPSHMPWNEQEAEMLFCCVPDSVRKGIRYFVENNCMQIVAANADKASGVSKICRWLGIQTQEAYAVGDSQEDIGMMKITQGLIPYRRFT